MQSLQDPREPAARRHPSALGYLIWKLEAALKCRSCSKGRYGRAARVEAFLNVELFRAMYDQYKGNALPPPPAIERQVAQLGVSPKQTERARQTFMKSAQYAGFIDASSGRFVKPGIVSREEAQPQSDKIDENKKRGSDDGNEPPDLHPFVQGLLKELPKAGTPWPEDQRKLWLDTAASIFKMIYKDSAPNKILPPPGDAEYRKAQGFAAQSGIAGGLQN